MHELSITQSILEDSIREAQKQNAARIRTIRLLMGPFCGIVPDCIQMYMDVIAQDTIAQGVKIEAHVLPLKVHCNDCGLESEITRKSIACPGCGSLKLKVLSGREFLIDSLEVDINGNQGTPSGDGME